MHELLIENAKKDYSADSLLGTRSSILKFGKFGGF